MGESKRRKQVGETEDEYLIRTNNWEYDKNLQKQTKNAHRLIRGRFDPETKEITE